MIDFGLLFAQLWQVFVDYFSQFAPSRLGINLLDGIIVVVVLFYAYEGFTLGLTLAFLDLVSFVFSFIVALKWYSFIAKLLTSFFSLSIGFANALGFFLVAFISEIVLTMLVRRLLRFMPRLRLPDLVRRILKHLDRWLGFIPGVISAFIVLSFLLSVIVSLPSSPLIKHLVTQSRIGSRLITNTSLFEKKLNDIFGGALSDTMNFLTVEPKSNDSINLHLKVVNGAVDTDAEQEMFVLVNQERAKAGLHQLIFDTALRDVARAHSQDMFARGYFSHYTPEGESPFDRMTSVGIHFTYAGENLALAPSTSLAMQGLMNSPGHRANILSKNFNKIGIGVIDGGIYGKMYSQEFTD